MKRARTGRQARGLTLIELMVTVALLGIMVALVGPSFKQFIDVQRIRSVNAALITDLQFARGEATSRNQWVGMKFDNSGTSVTCYVIFIGDPSHCDCSRNPGSNVCVGSVEIRTVQIPRDSSIVLESPPPNTAPSAANPWSNSIAFDPATGRIRIWYDDDWQIPPPLYPITVTNPSVGGFLNNLAATGRPSVCSPDGRIRGATPCP